MTSAIVLPSLTNWTEDQFSSIVKATTQADFEEAFDNFLAKHARVTVNGSHVSREHYKTLLQSEGALNQQSATVKFDGAVEVPSNQDAPEQVFASVILFLW